MEEAIRMTANTGLPVATPALSNEERLERCEIVYYPVCPFPLPEGDDRKFLLEQQLGGRVHKNISYDPKTGTAAGFRIQSPAQAERLRKVFAEFSGSTTAWLARALPRYAKSWTLDRVSFRPEEEATRQLRLTARNDLLHVDAFPSRPTNGWRILRVFANVNPSEPRVWATSDAFPKLLERYGHLVGLPSRAGMGMGAKLRHNVVSLFRPGKPRPSVYDRFMHRFHNYLKANDHFQEHGPKRHWTFPPGSAWMVFTDAVSHAAMRGRFALEHSYFIDPQSLLLPDQSPPAVLERACGIPVLGRAA
jgi:hypothetical protein